MTPISIWNISPCALSGCVSGSYGPILACVIQLFIFFISLGGLSSVPSPVDRQPIDKTPTG